MPAEPSADELRIVLVAKIARPRLLELRDEHDWESFIAACSLDAVKEWRQGWYEAADAVLDEALDAADNAILAHA